MNSVPSRPKPILLALTATTLLAATLATGCVKKATTTDALGDDDSSGGGTQTYLTRYLPSSYSVAIPKSLIKNSGGSPAGRMGARKSARSNALADAGDPGTEAEGYSELTNLVEMMQSRKKEISEKFFITDQIFEQVQATCQGVSGECVIEEGTLTAQYTEPMVNAIIESLGGAENLLASDLESLQGLIGTEIPVPEVRYQDLNGAGGYDHALSIVENGLPLTLSWNDAKSQISTYFEYGADNWGDGSDSFSYDLSRGVMVYRSGYSDNGVHISQTATFQADADKAALHGVKFSVDSKRLTMNSTDQFTIHGLADDLGGFAESAYLYSQGMVAVMEGEELIQEGVPYVLILKTMSCSALTAATDTAMNLGFIFAGDIGQWGTEPAGRLKVCSFDVNDNGVYINQTEITGVTLASTWGQEINAYYSETWNAVGTLLRAGVKDSSEGEYTYSINDAETSEYEDQYHTESSSGDFIASPQITVSGLDGQLGDLPEIFIVPDGTVPGAYDTSQAIGYASYSWNTEQYEYSYWGSADQIATADVYLRSWDDDLGDYVMTKISGAVVSAVQ